jgi:hypothetical protein
VGSGVARLLAYEVKSALVPGIVQTGRIASDGQPQRRHTWVPHASEQNPGPAFCPCPLQLAQVVDQQEEVAQVAEQMLMAKYK